MTPLAPVPVRPAPPPPPTPRCCVFCRIDPLPTRPQGTVVSLAG